MNPIKKRKEKQKHSNHKSIDVKAGEAESGCLNDRKDQSRLWYDFVASMV